MVGRGRPLFKDTDGPTLSFKKREDTQPGRLIATPGASSHALQPGQIAAQPRRHRWSPHYLFAFNRRLYQPVRGPWPRQWSRSVGLKTVSMVVPKRGKVRVLQREYSTRFKLTHSERERFEREG